MQIGISIRSIPPQKEKKPTQITLYRMHPCYQAYNLQDPVHNENAGPLVQTVTGER